MFFQIFAFHAEYQVTSKAERRRAWAITEFGHPLIPDENEGDDRGDNNSANSDGHAPRAQDEPVGEALSSVVGTEPSSSTAISGRGTETGDDDSISAITIGDVVQANNNAKRNREKSDQVQQNEAEANQGSGSFGGGGGGVVADGEGDGDEEGGNGNISGDAKKTRGSRETSRAGKPRHDEESGKIAIACVSCTSRPGGRIATSRPV